jgi:hypothetical protein
MQSGTLIRVHLEWNGWRSAEVRLEDFTGVHWFQPKGAPRQLLHGFISAEKILAGDLPDPGEGSLPPRLRVCVLKRHTVSSVFQELERRASHLL